MNVERDRVKCVRPLIELARRLSIFSLAVLLIAAFSSSPFAEGPPAPSKTAGTEPATDSEPSTDYVTEAARAVVGRIFGIEGEGGDVSYHAVDVSERSPGTAAFRSALVPGWGQYFNRQPRKGTVFLLAFVATAGASYTLNRLSKDSYDQYHEKGVKDDSSYDEYQRRHTLSLWLGISAAVLWTASVIDAYRNAYKPFYTRNDSGWDVACAPGQGTLQWKKRF